MNTINVRTWGHVSTNLFVSVPDGAGDDDIMEAIDAALEAQHISHGGAWCGQGTALYKGQPESYHYSTQADVYDPETGDVTTGQLWIAVDANDYEAAIQAYRDAGQIPADYEDERAE